MSTYVNQFLQDEQGQDLVEYSLLLAFIALAGITILGTVQSNIKGIWTKVNSSMAAANKAATADK